MRSVSYLAILITLLCGAWLQGQQTSASPAAVQVPPARRAAQNAAPQNDWRENLAKNSGAPVKVVEFFDYQCPFCGSTIPALEAALKNQSTKVEWILKHNPLPIHPDSMLAHQAALAAGEQGKFWEMHDLLFAHQRKVKLQDLVEYARQLHLDVPHFRERLESGYYKPMIEQDMALAKALGVTATPTFFVNGQKLVGVQTAERFQSAMEGTSPGPADKNLPSVSSLDLSHSPVRGAPDAPVTIIEFSDLQCPFCARTVPALQEVMKQYPTEVKWIFKNFPLSFHADSELAHRAVVAAGEQGKFWDMHDLIFAEQKAIKKDDLLQKARSLNLDMTKFAADLESYKTAKQVNADKKEGDALSVSGTPTFFINGKEYSGAMTAEKFESIIGQELALNPARAVPEKSAENNFEIASGPAGAPITFVWFSDLQSNLTVKATLLVRQIMKSYPGKIRLVFKNRPLETHPESMLLHEAALAANAQGKFWEMHDLIIANPQKTAQQDLVAFAVRIGLDVQRFQAELENHKYRPVIERDLDEAKWRAVQGTPVFFLDLARVDGLQSQKIFDDLIAAQLAKKLQASSH